MDVVINAKKTSDQGYNKPNFFLFIFDVLLLPIHLVRMILIYFWGSKYNLRGFSFLDVIMHANNPYFNQDDCRIIDTIGKDYRIVIRDDSRIFPIDILNHIHVIDNDPMIGECPNDGTVDNIVVVSTVENKSDKSKVDQNNLNNVLSKIKQPLTIKLNQNIKNKPKTDNKNKPPLDVSSHPNDYLSDEFIDNKKITSTSYSVDKLSVDNYLSDGSSSESSSGYESSEAIELSDESSTADESSTTDESSNADKSSIDDTEANTDIYTDSDINDLLVKKKAKLIALINKDHQSLSKKKKRTKLSKHRYRDNLDSIRDELCDAFTK